MIAAFEVFEVRLTRNAEKDLLRLRDLTERPVKEILILKQTPLKGHLLKGSLRGVRALEFSLEGRCGLSGRIRSDEK